MPIYSTTDYISYSNYVILKYLTVTFNKIVASNFTLNIKYANDEKIYVNN